MALMLAVLGAGCGGSAPAGPDTHAGLALQLVGGTYSDGSGRVGLAVLTTFRDAQGHGPAEAWTGTVEDSRGSLGVSFQYPVTSEGGSFGAFWWPDVGYAPGETYTVTLARADGASVRASFHAPDVPPLAAPRVDLTPDGAGLTWPAVDGAQGYGCQVYASGNLQLGVSSASPGCDVSALPAGTYSAAVTALSASWEALRADGTQRPALPQAFHVSEGRLAFARGTTGTTARAAAAGGAFSYGRVQPGLAVWVSLTRADGTALDTAAQVELVGPGLSASSPLRFVYPANATRHLVWSYEAQALEGEYTLSASVGDQVLSTRFSIGTSTPLDAAQGVGVTPSSSGGASVTWGAVASARAYYVSAYDSAGTFVTGQWTSEPGVRFASGTFTAGSSYDVYVAATDVDMSSPVRPDRLSVSENTYFPSSFTAQ